MSEQFPEAVNNNYQVEQSKDSDLLIAQSRAFHSYENVKSNPATEVPNPPKTHGISYR
jgi:hypothetical protein